MRLDQAQEDLFCAIANDENRTPHSMPGWYYSDQRLFELEKNKVFADGWVCVGHQSEISKIGQYVTATIGDEPIVILRDRQKQIRAFSNILPSLDMQVDEYFEIKHTCTLLLLK